jgi:signal peptidase II
MSVAVRPSAQRAWTRAGAVLGVVLVVDQLSKKLVQHNIAQGDENSVFPGVTLVHTQNKGVAFSALEGHSGLVVAAICIAVGALIVYFARNFDRPLIWLPTGLLAGGAVGNIFDRVRDGAVTDFLKLPLWPAFNVADLAITIGVLTLLYVIEAEDADHGDG